MMFVDGYEYRLRERQIHEQKMLTGEGRQHENYRRLVNKLETICRIAAEAQCAYTPSLSGDDPVGRQLEALAMQAQKALEALRER